jgi:IS605 OrfB family transposase
MADTTTRAYTLKLQGDRLALWRNHVAFNKGVRAWGDWLLTLRGGLPASLADRRDLLAFSDAEVKKAKKEREAEITPALVRQDPEFCEANDKHVRAEIAARKALFTESVVKKSLVAERRSDLRRVLALSWLCPETPVSLVPASAIVAKADDPDRESKVIDHFKKLLKRKGVVDANDWLADCSASLRAKIRPDAVWIDRSLCYDKMPKPMKPDEDDAAKHLFLLFGSVEDYFATAAAGEAEDKNYNTTAGNWISKNWGLGQKSDNGEIIAALKKLCRINKSSIVGDSGGKALAQMLAECGAARDGNFSLLCQAIGWRGKPNKTRIALGNLVTARRVSAELWDRFANNAAEECGSRKSAKGEVVPAWATALKSSLPASVGIPFKPADGRSHHFEYSTMLAFAMRRVSQIHTKAKQAEAERRSFAPEQERIERVPQAAKQWLDDYVEARTAASGALDGYQLRKRALGGWDEVVAAWAGCSSRDERVTAVRELRADWEKAGDTQLFEALAADDAVCVWRRADGKGDPDILADYVRAAVADQNAIRFKVPAYRHPDPLRSPSFIGFGKSQWSIEYSAQKEAKDRKRLLALVSGPAKVAERSKEFLARDAVLQDVSLDLWSGGQMQAANYRWQSRRLLNDLALHSIPNLEGASVTRATRFGRSQIPRGPVLPTGITADAEWNGRLQAPRRQLEDLARLLDATDLPYEDESAWPEKLRRRLQYIGWFLTHSANLTPSGPWLDYVAGGLANGWQWVKGRKGSYLFHEANEDRSGRAKLILSRLPGLRVLSVDLGLRTSAAAAVWQVVSKKELNAAKVATGSVTDTDLFTLVRTGKRTTVYRRIGDAAWARLDRQFLIRLDGEKAAARAATNAEWDALQKFRAWLGCSVETRPAKLPPVDRLQQSAERLCRLGLRCLSDLARVAFLLSAKERPIMGGRMAPLDEEGRIQAAQDALVVWHSLASSDEFVEEAVRNLWKTHVGEEPALAARLTKKQRQEMREALRPAAERLCGDSALSATFAGIWQNRSDEWKKHLRWLRDWVIPRFDKRTKGERVRTARDVGGLSLDRISTIRGVYQVMRAFASRPEPTNLRAGVERLEKAAAGKLRPEFGRRMLAKMERLRENRVKQIASRIVEAALGVGSEDRLHWQRGRKRPAVAIADPRFAPCQAVVIENLENYRPDDKRTRRENRGLMSWSARAVKKYLAEGCELYGLYLRQVSPSYTSRQDSRTASPGLRCNDVAVAELLNPASWVGRLVVKAEEAVKEETATPHQKLLVRLAQAASDGRIGGPFVRIIALGGQIFVAAEKGSPSSNGIHADMNAAANIGLVALLDPDWSASWWRLPCKSSTGQVDETKVGGSDAVPVNRALLEPHADAGKTHVNAWSDPADAAVSRRDWSDSKTYWRSVEGRVAEVLADWNLGGGRAGRSALPF